MGDVAGKSGLPEVSIMIAALFLLSTHIKIHKKPNGKWEILMEHKSVGDGKLEMIAQMILDLFKKQKRVLIPTLPMEQLNKKLFQDAKANKS